MAEFVAVTEQNTDRKQEEASSEISEQAILAGLLSRAATPLQNSQ